MEALVPLLHLIAGRGHRSPSLPDDDALQQSCSTNMHSDDHFLRRRPTQTTGRCSVCGGSDSTVHLQPGQSRRREGAAQPASRGGNKTPILRRQQLDCDGRTDHAPVLGFPLGVHQFSTLLAYPREAGGTREKDGKQAGNMSGGRCLTPLYTLIGSLSPQQSAFLRAPDLG